MENIDVEFIKDDWRIQDQDKYLYGKTFFWRNYSENSQMNDHDHCDFCTDEISDLPDTWHAGYSLLENPHSAVCHKCYEDFKVIFHWKAMTRDHFIHVIKPRILDKMKFNKEFIRLSKWNQPLITMKWNGDFMIEFGYGQNVTSIETDINVKEFDDAINEIN